VENSCELGNEPLGSIKCWELPKAAQLVASRAVLSSTELVITITIIFIVVMALYSSFLGISHSFSFLIPCHPDEGGAKFLRNVGSYKSHTA
jgi:hypothetical protein